MAPSYPVTRGYEEPGSAPEAQQQMADTTDAAVGVFRHLRTVTFGECDPAGVVYYPVFFDWFHQAMEAWFAQALRQPYAEVLQTVGFPAARTGADFRRPCRLGEPLAVEVRITRLGGSSLTLGFTVVGAVDGVVRATGETVCVCIPASGAAEAGFQFRPVPIPTVLRTAMEGVWGGSDGADGDV
jgi:4-hydroxybenzoyl-CoA thioesterase